MHLAPGSTKMYRGQQLIYLQFCEAYGMEPLAISEEELLRAVTHYVCTHTSSSLDTYCSAIQNLWTESGAGALPRGTVFKLGIRGLKRIFAGADEVVRMQALSLDEVAKMLATLKWDVPDDVCFGTQILSSFWASSWRCVPRTTTTGDYSGATSLSSWTAASSSSSHQVRAQPHIVAWRSQRTRVC